MKKIVILLLATVLNANMLASYEALELPKVKDAPSARGANLPHALPDVTLSPWATREAEKRLTKQLLEQWWRWGWKKPVLPPVEEEPQFDCSLTEIRCVGGAESEYANPQLCANVAQPGDTCLIDNSISYDNVLSTVNSGTAGNPITYRAVTDCASNNGETVLGSACAKIRRLTINSGDDYIVVQGLEITTLGFTADLNRPVNIVGSHSLLLNNYIHHTDSANPCVTVGGAFNVQRGNRVSLCGQTATIPATNLGPYNIQAGVNDKISVSIQGGAPQTVTLTPGAARTALQIEDDVDLALTGGGACGMNTANSCSEFFSISSDTKGQTSAIELLAVANDAYTTLGMTVGTGVLWAGAIGFAGSTGVTDWLMEYNNISQVSDCVTPGIGERFVFRNTTCGPSDAYHWVHIDMFQPNTFDKLLIENAVATDSNNIQNHIFLQDTATTHTIVRFMRTCRHRGSFGHRNGAGPLYFYNNTFYDNYNYFIAGDGAQLNIEDSAYVLARNNIWKNSRQNNPGVYQNDGTATIDHDFDLWYQVPNPTGSNNVNADPLVTDAANCDFTPTASSPAIDAGGHLTTVHADDTGSGTSLVLTDAKMFQDGWAGVTPDAIAVGTVSNVASISSIDYATGTVTLVAPGISRNDGDFVWLYSDSRGKRVLYGDAPDIGAIETAPTFYTRTDGHNTNCNGKFNASSASAPNCAWQTITKLATTLTSGHTGRVQAGDYIEATTVTVSGTLRDPITLVADGAVNTCGFSFTDKSYVRVVKFTMNGDLGACAQVNRVLIQGTNTGLEFWNNTLLNSDHGIQVGAGGSCNSCIIIGGEITAIEASTHAITITGNDNVVGYVDINDIVYLGIVPAGLRSRFLNLKFAEFSDNGNTAIHPDWFFVSNRAEGWSKNLIEGLWAVGSPTVMHQKGMHISNSDLPGPGSTPVDWEDNVWRNSMMTNIGSGLFSVYTNQQNDAPGADIRRLHFYNNTVSYCAQTDENNTIGYCGNFDENPDSVLTATIKNHIFYKAWGPNASTFRGGYFLTAGTFVHDYNAAYDPDGTRTFTTPHTSQANPISNVNPGLANPAGGDWTLTAGSASRGAATHLTDAVGAAGGGSSTSLTVTTDTGGMFFGSNAANVPQYGGALVPGDWITVGSTSVQVASVSGDVLTLATAINWADGANVYHGTSSTVDLGAYPYKATYALSASHALDGGVYTVTPNDASLVRFVVCYSAGVPYAVDNSSPYTCTAPSGTFEARAYPRYPSATLWAVSTP